MRVHWFDIIKSSSDFSAAVEGLNTEYSGDIETPPSYPCLLEFWYNEDDTLKVYRYTEVCDLEPGVEQTHYLDEDPAYVELMEVAAMMYMGRYE